MTPRRFFLLAASVGSLLGVFRIIGLLASYQTMGQPTRLEPLVWTFIGCMWWGLTVPFIVVWSERQPLVPGSMRRQVPGHLWRATVASVASGLAIWASKAVGTAWLGTAPFTLRELWGNMLSSWWLFDFFMYVVVLCIVSALAYQRQLREREVDAARLETALAQTEIKLLKAELDPHFVFNALHTISALVHRDPQAADRMICRLSDFLRLSLASTGALEVTLQQELAHLRSYMEVQMVRFRGRLTLEVDVPPELRDCQVPNLLLQPLIENVVKHAVAVGLKPVHAVVRARRAGDRLEIEIADDGPGLPPVMPGHPEPRREGIGLTNTRARLRKLYGEAHRLMLEDGPEGGTRVLVELPYREAAGKATPMDEPLELLEELPHVAGLHR
ncbi:MAG TPA: histidine kinase [Thermoanaerobaculia bacterium]|nr:histidine kinase [Thermoanaerobaculia bacterium]